jgi:hypothetical protein
MSENAAVEALHHVARTTTPAARPAKSLGFLPRSVARRSNVGRTTDAAPQPRSYAREVDETGSDAAQKKEDVMPRYVVERSFPSALGVAAHPDGSEACREVVERNKELAVVWLQSYVSLDDKRAFCLYEGHSPEAIRAAARRNQLPVDRITQIRVLDPYFNG